MSETPKAPKGEWAGKLVRGDEPGTVTGWLVDEWGWVIPLTGTRDVEGGGYILKGVLGPAPEALRIPIVDDPVDKDG